MPVSIALLSRLPKSNCAGAGAAAPSSSAASTASSLHQRGSFAPSAAGASMLNGGELRRPSRSAPRRRGRRGTTAGGVKRLPRPGWRSSGLPRRGPRMPGGRERGGSRLLAPPRPSAAPRLPRPPPRKTTPRRGRREAQVEHAHPPVLAARLHARPAAAARSTFTAVFSGSEADGGAVGALVLEVGGAIGECLLLGARADSARSRRHEDAGDHRGMIARIGRRDRAAPPARAASPCSPRRWPWSRRCSRPSPDRRPGASARAGRARPRCRSPRSCRSSRGRPRRPASSAWGEFCEQRAEGTSPAPQSTPVTAPLAKPEQRFLGHELARPRRA